MSSTFFLDAAGQIGRRIVRQAVWDGDACTWPIAPADALHADQANVAKGEFSMSEMMQHA